MGILAKRRRVIDSIVVAVSNEGQPQAARRERGGTLTLLVGGEDEAERAARILEAQGYHVVISPVLE